MLENHFDLYGVWRNDAEPVVQAIPKGPSRAAQDKKRIAEAIAFLERHGYTVSPPKERS